MRWATSCRARTRRTRRRRGRSRRRSRPCPRRHSPIHGASNPDPAPILPIDPEHLEVDRRIRTSTSRCSLGVEGVREGVAPGVGGGGEGRPRTTAGGPAATRRSPPAVPRRWAGTPAARARSTRASAVVGSTADDHPRRRLREPRERGDELARQRDVEAAATGDRPSRPARPRDHRRTRRARRAPRARTTSSRTKSCSAAATVEIGGRREPTAQVVGRRPLRPAELGLGVTEQHDRVAVVQFGRGRHGREVVDQTDDADHRRGVDVTPARLVVEAHVATDDGDPERAARVGHAVDDLGELPHHLGVLGVAEVEAVDERLRHRADAREVARRFDHDEARAGVRVERAEARLAVGGEREAARRCPSSAAPARHRRA